MRRTLRVIMRNPHVDIEMYPENVQIYQFTQDTVVNIKCKYVSKIIPERFIHKEDNIRY